MKVTQWFDGHVKPARNGVYQRAYDGGASIVFCRWDGDQWYAWEETVQAAAKSTKETWFPCQRWRGIAK